VVTLKAASAARAICVRLNLNVMDISPGLCFAEAWVEWPVTPSRQRPTQQEDVIQGL